MIPMRKVPFAPATEKNLWMALGSIRVYFLIPIPWAFCWSSWACHRDNVDGLKAED
jgi:hypothetical protein